MHRREFLAVSGASLVAPWSSLMSTDDVKLRRVCVSSWSFHTSFETDRNNPAKVLMDVRDFPEMIADKYHVHNVEMVLPHFGAATPPLRSSRSSTHS
jgi:hypothetical protein